MTLMLMLDPTACSWWLVVNHDHAGNNSTATATGSVPGMIIV